MSRCNIGKGITFERELAQLDRTYHGIVTHFARNSDPLRSDYRPASLGMVAHLVGICILMSNPRDFANRIVLRVTIHAKGPSLTVPSGVQG